jgi:N-acetylmuramic acid 6-phosphate etherase
MREAQMVEIDRMPTEQSNPRSAQIDSMSVMEMVELINSEDSKVAEAVGLEKEHIAQAIDVIYRQLHTGGRLIYCGAGTSGRLGILDAVECPPTYSTDPEMIQGLIAGGETAIFRAVEGAEDDVKLGKKDLQEILFSDKDVLVGVAASGRTPYVMGAMQYAKKQGAPVIAVTCSPGSKIDKAADIGIAPYPGPEVITGSTRMKCGTAQKMVLNMLTTCTMIKLGKVYGNLMVDVNPSNEKLMQRCISIICAATGCREEQAKELLVRSDNRPKTAIVMQLCNCDEETAGKRLAQADGHIYDAIR